MTKELSALTTVPIKSPLLLCQAEHDSIVCLPNKVVVTCTVTEGEQAAEDGVDAVI